MISIGNSAFSGCESLANITIPDSVTSIGSSAFYYCTSLTSITIPDNVTTIESYAFSGCTSLVSVTIPDSVTSIDDHAFWCCESITSITIPGSVTSIGMAAFAYCTSLTSITIPDSVTDIDAIVFYECRSLANITISGSVTSIGRSAFSGCTSLVSITIPESVTSISSSAFENCNSDLIIYCMKGSYTEQWAVDNGYNYEYIIADDNINITLCILNSSGAEAEEEYTVYWYADGALAGEGTSITVANGAEEIKYQIILGEEASFKYYQPSAQTVEAKSGEVTYTLSEIETVSASGAVKDSGGSAIAGAEVKITQTANNKYTKTTTVSTDKNGKYEAEILNLPTKAIASAENYYTAGAVLIDDTAEGDVAADIVLTKMPESRLTLSMTQTSAVQPGETAITSEIKNANGISFEIYNETTGKDVDFTVQYPYITLNGGVSAGDVLTVNAASDASSTTDAGATITLDDAVTGTAELNFIENGGFAATVASGTLVMLFDESGVFVKKYISASAAFSTSGLQNGAYTAVFMEETELLTAVTNISRLADYSLINGSDYEAVSFSVESGVINNLGSITVPQLDIEKLYYTNADGTSVTANKTTTIAGSMVMIRTTYEMKDGVDASGQRLGFEIADNLQFVENSVTIDGSAAGYTYDNNVLTVYTNADSAAVRFYCIPEEVGEFTVNGELSFNTDGSGVCQPVGTASFEATAMTLTAPEKTGKNLTVSGKTLAKSAVALYDNDTLVGETTANSAGTWSYTYELRNAFTMMNHNIYAVAESPYGSVVTSETAQVIYQSNYTRLSKVTMIVGSQTLEFDFLNVQASTPSYSWESSFTFKVEFTDNDPDVISDVYAVTYSSGGSETYVPCTYDPESGCWIGTATYTSSNTPASVTAAYNLNVETPDLFDEESGAQFAQVYCEAYDVMEAAISPLLSYTELESEDENTCEMLVSLDVEDGGYIGVAGVELLDYADFDLDAWLTSENGACYSSETESGEPVYLYFDCNEEYDSEMYYAFPESEEYVRVYFYYGNTDEESEDDAQLFALPALIALALISSDLLMNIDAILADIATPQRELVGCIDALEVSLNTAVILANCRCSKCGEYMLSEEAREMYTAEAEAIRTEIYEFRDEMTARLNLINVSNISIKGAIMGISAGAGDWLAKGIGGIISKIPSVSAVLAVKFGGNAAAYASQLLTETVGGKFVQMLDAYGTATNMLSVGFSSLMIKIENLQDEIRAVRKLHECKEDDKPDPNDPPRKTDYTLDPSGYVYEAVPSNRVEGVTATAYTLEEILDEFYEPTGEYEAVMWDAADYDQVNPLTTDANGEYAWDVPEGQWMVEFEKDGYETTYSEWLPVPPPQTEVNVGIVSLLAPEVKAVNIYSDSVRIEFTQYMEIDSVNCENVSVILNGSTVSGTIVPLNAEETYDGTATYASIFSFVPTSEMSGIASVEIKNAVNYAGREMESAFTASASVVPAPTGIDAVESVSIGYNSSALVEITVLDGDAGKNVTLMATSSSPSIVSVVNETAVTDENGKATFALSGNLPGSGEITVTIDGTDISWTIAATVGGVVTTERCGKVTASVESGSVVEKGTKVELSSSTSGAVIYYTTDGTDPTESETRMLYTEAIEINSDTVILAYAEKDGIDPSGTAGFAYTVEADGEATCSIQINISNAVGGKLIAAAYDEEGTMLFARMFDAEAAAQMTLTLENVRVSDANKMKTVKIFHWSTDFSMQPIAAVTSATIN
ncbi:MAG: leucine-rich repeat protein [Clostridia bacterium]|nr:leucine-rich repeat protein [Clostridia bacterium]